MLVVNDPYLGGTHLPDVTVIAPVFVRDVIVGFVANRAHHANIGCETPGSMPMSQHLEEGDRNSSDLLVLLRPTSTILRIFLQMPDGALRGSGWVGTESAWRSAVLQIGR